MTHYPSMPQIRYVSTNGIRMGIFEAGPEDGLPLILCHGFPELAYSWRHQIPALAAAGYRVIAPDQRGYGFTDAPRPVEAYDIHHLTGDLAGLLDALELEQAIFIAHDWGAITTWQMAMLHPSRVMGVACMCVPFIPRLRDDPIKLMRAALGEDFYIVRFQPEGEIEADFDADPARTLRYFLRRSPITAEAYLERPKERQVAGQMSEYRKPEERWSGTPVVTDAELQVYVEAFTRSGFRGPVNWYRNMTRNWETTAHVEQKVTQPTLMLTASHDVLLPPSTARGMHKYVPDLQIVDIEDAGHFVQFEQPEAVNAALLAWLGQRFG